MEKISRRGLSKLKWAVVELKLALSQKESSVMEIKVPMKFLKLLVS